MSKTKAVSVERVRTQIFFDPAKDVTKQSFSAECNINTIMAKYARTGLIEHVSKRQGNYGDFSNVQNYHDSINQVNAAHDMFYELPSALRKRFSNDPGSFIDFVSDPNNIEEMRSLGLLEPVKVDTVVPLDPVREEPVL